MSPSSSQDWLKGQNQSIDSFFTKVGSSSSSFAGGKRKRKSSGKDGANTSIPGEIPSKRSKACDEKKPQAKANVSSPVRDHDIPPFASCSKARSNDRNALDDVTARQNNLRTRAHTREGLAQRSGRFSFWKNSELKSTRSEIIPESDSPDESDDAPSHALVFNPTPSRPFKTKLSHMKGNLLTPPPSSIAMNRTKGNELPPESSPNILSFPKPVFDRTAITVAHTPSALSSALPVKSYPTPDSMSFPRLKLSQSSSSLRPLPALRVHLESASASSLSPPLSKDNDVESHNECDYDIASLEVPSSQTQYLHYSPKKKTAFSTMRFKPPSNSEIPSSQSQPAILSPRKMKKPAPLSIEWDSRESGAASLNVVVPTSQEDELEISLQNVVDPRLSQLLGKHAVVNSIKDVPKKGSNDLSLPEMSLRFNAQLSGSGLSSDNASADALPEAEAAPASPPLRVVKGPGIRTASCGMSVEDAHDVNLSKAAKEHWQGDLETQSLDNPNLDTSAMMQSSMTEPDSWGEDPFASTNRAYMNFLCPHPSASQRSERRNAIADCTSACVDNDKSGLRVNEPVGSLTCTQASATQVDTDDEDPFPTLPPVSTAGSSVGKTTMRRILPPSQGPRGAPKEDAPTACSSRQLPLDIDQTQSQDYASQIQSMPEIGSLDDSFDVKAISPRRVVARMHQALGGKFKRQDGGALDGSYLLDADENDYESDGVGSMPAVVRDFLDMFDSQSQDDADAAFLP